MLIKKITAIHDLGTTRKHRQYDLRIQDTWRHAGSTGHMAAFGQADLSSSHSFSSHLRRCSSASTVWKELTVKDRKPFLS